MEKLVLTIPSLQPGGMERVMSELICYFNKLNNIEIHLILYGISRDVFYEIPSKVIVHRPDFIFDNSQRFWCTFKTFYFVRTKIKELNPDSVLSFGELWNNFVLLSTLGLGVPIYVSDRCQPDKSLGKLHDRLRKYLYPRAAGIVCQTEVAKTIYQKIFKHHNFSVIGNPIRDILPKGDIAKEKIVLSVGRLITTKHHDEMIKLFAAINLPGWKLVIVGDDALKQKNREKLRRLIRDLGIEDRVILTGNRSDVDIFYLKSKIFAFTSSSEGFPNAIGEAMSASLPVIAFDCIAGPADMIDDGENGFLIPMFDYPLFKRKLKTLMEDEKLCEQFGTNARLRIKDYSVDTIGDKFSKLILK